MRKACGSGCGGVCRAPGPRANPLSTPANNQPREPPTMCSGQLVRTGLHSSCHPQSMPTAPLVLFVLRH